jgi:hypothetical protein
MLLHNWVFLKLDIRHAVNHVARHGLTMIGFVCPGSRDFCTLSIDQNQKLWPCNVTWAESLGYVS